MENNITITLNFDMDGTIANLYAVEGWLEKLRAFDPSPYVFAKPLINMSLFARYVHKLQAVGYRVAINSWLSKCSNEEYDQAVISAKKEWLKQHLPSVEFDDMFFLPYGEPKEHYAETNEDILFDDELNNREHWYGAAYEPSEIFAIMKQLLE